MAHANAALTPRHRLNVARLVVDADWPISEVSPLGGRDPVSESVVGVG